MSIGLLYESLSFELFDPNTSNVGSLSLETLGVLWISWWFLLHYNSNEVYGRDCIRKDYDDCLRGNLIGYVLNVQMS